MIVKNEAALLGQLLEEAKAVCDELVVVDTGSTDDTRSVAEQHGAKIFDFAWTDDFAAARNFALEQCTGQWMLWLDADDRLPPAARKGFVQLKQELARRSEVSVVMVPYRVAFAADDPAHCTFSYERERVVRLGPGVRWAGAIHEVVVAAGGRTIRWPEAWVEHRPPPERAESKVGRNLRILEKAYGEGDRTSRTLFYFGNELREHRRFQEALDVYRQYLEHTDVVDWERYSALLHVSECLGALERHDDKLGALLDAVRLDSTRAEAFVRLGLHHYERRQWPQAAPFFAAATQATRPAEGFIDEAHYSWVPWDYLSICFSELGRYQEAMDATLRALRTTNDRKRLFANMEFYLNQLRPESDPGSS